MQGLSNIFFLLFIMGGLIVLTLGFAIPLIILYCVLVFLGAKKRAEKVRDKLSTTLMQGEEIVEQSIQLRVFAFSSRRVFLAITSSRVIFIHRGLLGGFKMEDIQWKDLRDVKISENILPKLSGSNLTFHYCFDDGAGNGSDNAKIGGGKLSVGGIPTDVALRIYSKSQAEEQAWQEKRRIRNIEEKRAAAGGVVVNGPSHATPHNAPVPTPTPETAPDSIAGEIEKAKQLLDSGAISDAEFNEIKAKILSKNY